jgi:GNAT superfamily N-acetyltransferase
MLKNFTIRAATETDAALILSFIHGLAEYEELLHEVVATEDSLRESLFGKHRAAEVVIGEWEQKPVAFALYFHNYSTFLGRSGIYLEDLYVNPDMRGRGIGKSMLTYLAQLTCARKCGRLEWSVLDWNEPALKFYHSIGAVLMDEWTVHRLTGDALTQLAGGISASGRLNII